MKTPKGVDLQTKLSCDHVLKLHRNYYDQENAVRLWNQCLVKKLKKTCFKQSNIDEYIFYKGKVMCSLYVDESILTGPDPKEIDDILKIMRKAKLDITEEGTLKEFLGVNIDKKSNGTIHLTQLYLIDNVLGDLNLLGKGVKTKTTPAIPLKILKRHTQSEDFDNSFNYKAVIGKLNGLERGSPSDIVCIVYQCARFSTCPKKEH